MPQKTPMRDMVVILPGILGSVLQKDGKDLWAVSGHCDEPGWLFAKDQVGAR
jgi:hypothetical protein